MSKRVLRFIQDMRAFVTEHPKAELIFAGVHNTSDDKSESEVIAQASPDGLVIAATALMQAALEISTSEECGECSACKERAAWIREALAVFPSDLVGSALDDVIGATEGRC